MPTSCIFNLTLFQSLWPRQQSIPLFLQPYKADMGWLDLNRKTDDISHNLMDWPKLGESGRRVSWIAIISSFNNSHHQYEYQIIRSKLHRIILLDGLFFDSLIFKGPVHTSTYQYINHDHLIIQCSELQSRLFRNIFTWKAGFFWWVSACSTPQIRLEAAKAEINKRITRGNLGECLKHQPALLL